ncbi:hypothetical protein [Arthrobacter sp. H20]|uniref:hypothetical protein n=1 Tax=Arthrobacter sp. H20 TaxID=1267981 RepID=UPI000569A840|nr:hypothetical protein [Arthrobacter sp. H20]
MSTPDAVRAGSPGDAVLPISGPTGSLWMMILRGCLTVTGALALLAFLLGLVAVDLRAALSYVASFSLVATFFSISLLVGHYGGRRNPTRAMTLFALTYLVKVVGFGALLIVVGTPDWLDRTWFLVGGLATVVLWQIVELYLFSKSRHLLYDDPETVDRTSGKERDHEAQ